VKPGRGGDPLLRRPFSVFEVIRDHGRVTGLTLLSKRIGITTSMLFDAVEGDTISCLGPLGKPFELVEPPAEAWMVAGGVGLAPFATLGEALVARGTKTTLFYGARRAADLHCAELFEKQGVRLVLSTEDGSRGTGGMITTPLDAELQKLPASRKVRLYVCGPTPMMRAVATVAATHGRPCDVSLEQVMGCGMGGCYSCVVPARDAGGAPHHTRSCIDGPVFDATRIVWEALAH
jgi:dihydroorotate dehydrogenase electron transfer subunit